MVYISNYCVSAVTLLLNTGWWQYDDRTSQDIEEAYKKGEKSCTILVAGYVYIVDLETMMQQRQNEPTRCRRVKRDLATIPKKGVAGLRVEGNQVTTESNYASSTTLFNADATYDELDVWNPSELVLPRYSHERDTDDDDDDDDDDGDERLMRFSLPIFDYTGNRVPETPNTNRLASNTNGSSLGNLISTMAATDAAIRIASDIIGSTLAHADELSRGGNANIPLNDLSATSSSSSAAAAAAAAGSTSVPLNTTTSANYAHASTATTTENNQNGEQANVWPMMTHNLNDNVASGSNINANGGCSVNSGSASGSGRSLPTITNNAKARKSLIAQADAAATANQQAIDLFEQALNDFHALTMHNIVDSSDENDEEHTATTTPATTTSDYEDDNEENLYTHRQLRF